MEREKGTDTFVREQAESWSRQHAAERFVELLDRIAALESALAERTKELDEAKRENAFLSDKLDFAKTYKRDLVSTLNEVARIVGHPTSDPNPEKLLAKVRALATSAIEENEHD